MITVRNCGVEIYRIAGVEHRLFVANSQHELPAEHVDEFDSLVLVRKWFSAREGWEVGKVGVDLALDRVEVQSLEVQR